MIQPIFFPKGNNNKIYIVYGSILFDEQTELDVNKSYENKKDAIDYYNKLLTMFSK